MTVGLREGDKLAAVAVRHGYGSEYKLAQAALAYCEGALYLSLIHIWTLSTAEWREMLSAEYSGRL